MNNQHDTPRDSATCEVWRGMDPAERLLYLLHEDEHVPPEVSERARQAYRDLYEQPDTGEKKRS